MKTATFIIVVALVSLAPMGCGGGGRKDFSPEDFKKVTVRMTEAQVKEILGNPTETHKPLGMRLSIWKVGDKYYWISFDRGKVVKREGPTDKDEIDDLRRMAEK
jgi:hypothetical protein